jgi:5-methyltetrahydropteroyltriglutamate--homocysteine methyltransferase
VKTSTSRIITTHVGSLARPHALLDQLKAKAANDPSFDEKAYAATLKSSVAEMVHKQAECGIDVVSDGEMSKPNFINYARDRMTGFEITSPAPGPQRPRGSRLEREMFPEYHAMYDRQRAERGYAVPFPEPPLACTGPIEYVPDGVQTDIANLKAALQGVRVEEVFMPAATPRNFIRNEYYSTEADFQHAYADALHQEYRAIIDAGFICQVDDSAFAAQYGEDPDEPEAERRKVAEQAVELINYAIRGLPADRLRFHTCYGTNIAPRMFEAPLKEIIDLLLMINVGAYSFEASNPRHAHDWHLWESFKLPAGKVLIPGFITHSTTLVEHPEWIADNIVTYASLVGPENLIAGADCGFSSLAMYQPEIMAGVVWAKFQSLAEGAAIATKRIWRN